MEPEAIGAIIGGAAVALHIGGIWLRELRKHKSWKTNGKDLRHIKEKVEETKVKMDGMDGKLTNVRLSLTRVETKVDGQQKTCTETVGHFTKAIATQHKEILDLAKGK